MTQKRLINITCYKYIPKIKKANGNSEQVMYNIVMIGHLDFQFKPFTIKLANKNAIKYREA